MRMKRRWLPFHEERGASAVMVAILLLVLLGFTALAVDGGALYSRRRHMVTAADAAALAAAQWCAKTGNNATGAKTQANLLATDNVSTTQNDLFQIVQGVCGVTSSGKVKVTYHANQDLFFAPALGFAKNRPVHATSYAVWGAAGSGAGMMPMMLSASRLTSAGCDIPPGPAIGTQCAFWWNNKDIGNAQWSMLNLKQWNVAPTTNCTSAGTDATLNWMNGGAGVLSMNTGGQPTYVCIDTGVATSVFGTPGSECGTPDEPLICKVNDTDANGDPVVYAFPVNEPGCRDSSYADGGTQPGRGQIGKPLTDNPPGTQVCPPGTADKYDIIGFASLSITGLYKGNTTIAKDGQQSAEFYCRTAIGYSPDPNAWCLVTTWQGYDPAGGIGGGGTTNYGLTAVYLVDS